TVWAEFNTGSPRASVLDRYLLGSCPQVPDSCRLIGRRARGSLTIRGECNVTDYAGMAGELPNFGTVMSVKNRQRIIEGGARNFFAGRRKSHAVITSGAFYAPFLLSCRRLPHF